MKSVPCVLLTASFLLLITIHTTSCSFGCRDNGPDGDPVRPPVVEIVLVPSSSSPESRFSVSEYKHRQDVENVFLQFRADKEDLFSLDRTGTKFFINSNYFDAETNSSRTSLTASDSLSFCSFTRLVGDAVCVVTQPDTLFNAFTARSLPVNVGRSSISMWEDFRAAAVVLFGDSARFTSEDLYMITTMHHPVISDDDRRLAFIRQIQTRRVVQDADGAVIDDVLVSAQNDLVLQNIASAMEPEVLLENVSIDERLYRHLAISPDGNQVALAQDDGSIYLIDTRSNVTTQIDGVGTPTFSASSRFLIGEPVSRSSVQDLILYDLENNLAQDTLPLVQGPYAVDVLSDLIFYYTNPPAFINDSGIPTSFLDDGEIRAYSIVDGTDNTLFVNTDLGDYEERISNGRRSATPSPPYFIGTDRNGQLHLISEVFFSLIPDC